MLAISQTLLSAAATDETTAVTPAAFKNSACRSTTHHVSWGTGVTSGVVEIEAADDPAYSGTWKSLATVTFAGTAPNQDVVTVQGAYEALRHRISTVVADGTVTTRIVGEGD